MNKYSCFFIAVLLSLSCLLLGACEKGEESAVVVGNTKISEAGNNVVKEKTDISEKEKATDPKYSWDLSEIYPDVAAWRQAKDTLQKKLPDIARYQGRLAESSSTLVGALDLMFGLKKEGYRLSGYAMFLSDLDTRVAANEALVQEVDTLDKQFSELSAFVVPEILSLDQSVIDGFVATDPKLKVYQFYLANLLRMKAHTRSPEVEKLVAQAGQALDAPEKAYGTFSDAELPAEEIELSTGEKIRLDKSGYVKYRSVQNLTDRHNIFKTFWNTYDKFKATLGTLLYGEVMGHLFLKDVKGYQTSLEAALDKDAIPASVYEQLIKDVHDNLPVFHRYLKLRQKMMGLSELKYEDLYVSLVKEVDRKYTVDEAQELVLSSLTPLGEAAVDMVKTAFEKRWVDFFPAPGKRSGAYSEGSAVYDLHPFQLLNFSANYESVSTLAHEMGHGLHSYFTNKQQPFIYADYTTFVAEVASTINEAFLFKYMLPRTKTDEERLNLLGARLDDFRQTLFRQAMFADFELKVHQMAERGEPLTGESMSQLYLELLRDYHGHDRKICTINELYGNEWAYIPHFYYNFYVFTYATSLTASTDIARRIVEDETAAKPTHEPRDAYLKMLSSGASAYPIDLLKIAGVDMTTSQPFNAAIKEMNEIMDEMDKLLGASQQSDK
ncbi:MAG: hypothetical protein ACD_62C00521G0005 [uncultured bacterium]|nr:MAG: hypothetical protein ACD_62C00521G0005 [uncultured bacterium]